MPSHPRSTPPAEPPCVTDPRLVRVLDVGSHDGYGYVVSEQLVGPSLAELAGRAPLTADQARAVVGEAAAALEVARRRGVHHLALRPSVVHVSPDGRVLVGGLALDAALLGNAGGDARSTTRADAVGLVRLLYAALTGYWPGDPDSLLPTGGDTLPLAPTVNGSPVPPADLVPGIPNDLDTLCAVTLGPNDDGPHSPGDLVRELEPWGEIRTSRLGEDTAVAATAAAAQFPPTGEAASEPAPSLPAAAACRGRRAAPVGPERVPRPPDPAARRQPARYPAACDPRQGQRPRRWLGSVDRRPRGRPDRPAPDGSGPRSPLAAAAPTVSRRPRRAGDRRGRLRRGDGRRHVRRARSSRVASTRRRSC